MPKRLTRRTTTTGAVRWYAQAPTGEVDTAGHRVYCRGTFKTKGAAEAFLRKLGVAKDEGLVVRPSGELLGDYLGRWLEDVVQHRLRENTVQSYRQIARIYLVPALGRMPLSKLSPGLIRTRLFSPMLERGLSATTIEHAHAVLNQALNQAVADGLLPRNPAKGTRPPREQARREIQGMTREEARRFLAAADGDRLRGLWRLLLAVGLRPSEALGLEWRHLELDGDPPALRVEQTLVRLQDRWLLRDPKTDGSRRVIPLSPETVEDLRRHRVAQLEDRLRAGASWQDSAFVFTDEAGEPLRLNLVRTGFYAVCRRAGLGEEVTLPGRGLIDRPRHEFRCAFRLYDLRHSAATLALEAGAHVKFVSAMLGHSSVSFTLDVYTSASTAAKMDATDRLAAALFR
ncbi:MAG TPA: tyrosine-type recombinase/integrase [Thermoanaerobaculales bacterium]|nr:tyrosine-type recombinase/integrase [Thermoanaerobaculales bacterium]HQN97252.1 tyrosine-type recombinase/integrase [Thermoanaerobaculales bacterium]HQP42854.1 tyrosine-type recombinase/integrase [Thermoanaerobaculales bacterium]